MGLVVFGLRKNTHIPVSGSAVPSVAITRLIRVLEGEGATSVRSISAKGMAGQVGGINRHKSMEVHHSQYSSNAILKLTRHRCVR